MQINEFRNQIIREQIGIKLENFGSILTFIDFSNVNYWYENDERDEEGNKMKVGDKLVVGIEKLANFCDTFSDKCRFYYGLDERQKKSIHIISLARKYFGRYHVNTKQIQLIKHYVDEKEIKSTTRSLNYDKRGTYIKIPKCNFDVEICVDAIRSIKKYDTFCLFSSDADFVALLRFIKNHNKKIILVKGGPTQKGLKQLADLVIGAQEIKKYITFKKLRNKIWDKQKSRR